MLFLFYFLHSTIFGKFIQVPNVKPKMKVIPHAHRVDSCKAFQSFNHCPLGYIFSDCQGAARTPVLIV